MTLCISMWYVKTHIDEFSLYVTLAYLCAGIVTNKPIKYFNYCIQILLKNLKETDLNLKHMLFHLGNGSYYYRYTVFH